MGVGLTLATAIGLSACAPAEDSAGPVAALPTERFVGDLDAIRERRVLRVLVVPSRTDFFLVGAEIEGLQARLAQAYEQELNRGVRRATDQIRLRFLPVTFDRLIPELMAGHGDIAAAMLTLTPEREARVAMVSARAMPVDELVVGHRGAEPPASLDDLSGRTVQVLRGSSYAEHLRALNTDLASRGLAPVRIEEADARLHSEDILEMVNAGVVPLTVVDDYKARLWAQVFEDIVVHEDLKLSRGGQIGWAVRKDNPKLQASVSDFLTRVRKGTLLGNLLSRRYLEQTDWITDPRADVAPGRLERLMPLFRRYGERYDIDPLALLAQAYQESGLDPTRRSPRGAVGLMQLLPSTAADPNVAIADIQKPANNIHAAAKYLAFLRDRYFSDDEIPPRSRLPFLWAAYNAGPGKVLRMRALAERMGLDPNRWFGHVEVAAGRVVGRETVKYVADVQKYLIAYRLMAAHAEQREALAR